MHSLFGQATQPQTGQNHAFTLWTSHTATDWSKPCIHSLDKPHSHRLVKTMHSLWTNHTATYRLVKTMYSLSGQARHRLVKTRHSLSRQTTQPYTDWSKPCIHSLDKPHSHIQTGQNHAFTLWTNHTVTYRLVKTMHSLSGQLTTQPHTDWSKPCIHSLDKPHSHIQTGQNHAFTLWTINHTATHRLVKTMHSLSEQTTQPQTGQNHAFTLWTNQTGQNHVFTLCTNHTATHRLVKTMHSLSGQLTTQPHRLVKTMHSLSGQTIQPHTDWSKPCIHSLDN